MDKGPELRQLLSLGEPDFDLAPQSDRELVVFDRIICDAVLDELPLPGALTAEATDYVVHFFGLNCYDRWRTRQDDDRSA